MNKIAEIKKVINVSPSHVNFNKDLPLFILILKFTTSIYQVFYTLWDHDIVAELSIYATIFGWI